MFVFEILVFEMFRAAMFGFEWLGLEMLVFEMFVFEMLVLEMLVLEMFVFEMLVLEMFVWWISMLDTLPAGFPSGLIRAGAVGSGFSTAKLPRPPFTWVPPMPLISVTLMVMLAVGLFESTKTGRDAPGGAAMATAKMVSGAVSAGRGVGIGTCG